MGVEDAVKEGGGVDAGEAGLAAGRSRRGGGTVDGVRDEGVLGEVTLPGERKSVRCARSFVRTAVLGLVGPDDPLLDDMVTVVSETVANAVTHTASGREGGRVTVVVSVRGGVFRVEVADGGAGGARPHVKEEVGAETGRGLRIVDALAARWGFRADGHRTVVWAEFVR